MVQFSDKTASAYTGGNQATAIAAASITTICGTPAASTVRDIDHVTLYCALANTLTVGQTVSGTEYILVVAALDAGDTLEYTHARGWQALNSSGQLKLVMPGYLQLTGGTLSGALTLSAALTYGGVTLSNAVTGTGNMVLSASPTLTGTLTAAIANFSGAVGLNAGAVIAASQALTGTVANSTISGFLSVAATTGTFTNLGGTLSTATQNSVTTMTGLVTVGALNAGSITSGFGAINIGTDGVTAGAVTVTSASAGGTSYFLTNTFSDTSNRNWSFLLNGAVFGDFHIVVGATEGAAPTLSKFNITKEGAVTIPGTLGVTGAISGSSSIESTGSYVNGYTQTAATTRINSAGKPSFFTIGAGNTVTFTIGTGDVAVFSLSKSSSGTGALVFVTNASATVTIIQQDAASFEASSTPSASAFGIFKSAGTNVVSIKAGVSATQGIAVTLIGTYASATTDPA